MTEKFFIFILILVSLSIGFTTIINAESKGIIINEVMANPVGTDTQFEWIELYNYSQDEINISGWTIDGSNIISGIIQPNNYLILVRNLLSYPDLMNKVQASFNLANSSDEVVLKDELGSVIDIFSYTSSVEGKSNERKGILCEGYDLNIEGDSIENENLNYDPECFAEEQEEEFEFKVEFSTDQFEWFDSIQSYGEASLYLRVNSEFNEEINNLIWLNEDDEELESPILLTNYVDQKVKAQFVFRDKEYEIESESITIYPIQTIQISEIYPNLNSGEEEWIELYNFGNEAIDLKSLYFADNKECSQVTNKIFLNGEVNSKGYAVINKEQNGVSLNDSGDNLRLCFISNDLVDEFIYESSVKGKSISKKFENDKYLDESIYFTNPTPGLENKIEESETSESPETILDIKSAKLKPMGSKIVIEGYLSTGFELLFANTFYVQDDSGGIRIYFDEDPGFQINQKVRIIGKLGEVSGEKKINAESVEVLNDFKSYNPITLNQNLNLEELEGMLIYTEGTIINNFSSSFDIQTPKGIMRVSILSMTGIEIDKKSKGDFVRVTGILSRDKDKFRLLPFLSSQVEIFPNTQIIAKKGASKTSQTKTNKVKTVSSSENREVKGLTTLPELPVYNLPNPAQEPEVLKILPLLTLSSGFGFLLLAIVFRRDLKNWLSILRNSEEFVSIFPRNSV